MSNGMYDRVHGDELGIHLVRQCCVKTPIVSLASWCVGVPDIIFPSYHKCPYLELLMASMQGCCTCCHALTLYVHSQTAWCLPNSVV